MDIKEYCLLRMRESNELVLDVSYSESTTTEIVSLRNVRLLREQTDYQAYRCLYKELQGDVTDIPEELPTTEKENRSLSVLLNSMA